jgi:hypothetical protein
VKFEGILNSLERYLLPLTRRLFGFPPLYRGKMRHPGNYNLRKSPHIKAVPPQKPNSAAALFLRK